MRAESSKTVVFGWFCWPKTADGCQGWGMMPSPGSSHPQVAHGRVGLLLLNLGTPDGTDYWSMRRYLNEFLSDPRVVELNPVLWQIILQLIILTFRPARSGRAYAKIWDKERNDSPLRVTSEDQVQALRNRWKDSDVVVEYAMRYGNPSIESVLQRMKDQGCERIVALALYPQYSAATTATAYDKVFEVLQKMRWQPSVRTAPPYYDDPVYVKAIAESIQEHIATLDWQPDVLMSSFHGLPQENLQKGDPYYCHCMKTGRLLKERLGRTDDDFVVTFQSRFGPSRWLEPYTDETLQALPDKGTRNVVVVTPGFAVDCVETLEEIAIGGAEMFEEAGGQKFSVVPCLNATDRGIDVIEAIARRELAGWADLSGQARPVRLSAAG